MNSKAMVAHVGRRVLVDLGQEGRYIARLIKPLLDGEVLAAVVEITGVREPSLDGSTPTSGRAHRTGRGTRSRSGRRGLLPSGLERGHTYLEALRRKADRLEREMEGAGRNGRRHAGPSDSPDYRGTYTRRTAAGRGRMKRRGKTVIDGVRSVLRFGWNDAGVG